MFDVKDYIQKGKRYYIYGTKAMGRYSFHKITEQSGNETVIGFIETEPSIEECCQKKVYALREIENLDEDTYIILASSNYFKEIEINLVKKGIDAERIIIMDKVYPYLKNIGCYKDSCIKKICFWPPIKECDKDIQKKISWFLPDKMEITIWCEPDIRNEFNNNVYVGDLREVEKKFTEADAIYVWNMTDASDISDAYLSKIHIVDPLFWSYAETANYCTLYYDLLSESEKLCFLDESKELFHKLEISIKTKRANIFCSGPSIEEIYNADLGEAVNLITNSMVKDKKFLEQISPKILVFTDVNFYLSPHEYCKKFYEDVLEAVKKYDLDIIVFEDMKPLLLRHFPELKGKVIGIPYDSDQGFFSDKERFYIKNTGNILTNLLLPIASTLCDEIGIAGCTGRNPDETYYWKHNPNTQYLDLMQSVFDMYPSVFRDQKYDEYYDKHCKNVEDMIEYGEQLGKKYINMTTSYIPALRNRSVEGLN